MKPWIYIFITTEKLNFDKMSVTTLLHSHDDLLFTSLHCRPKHCVKDAGRDAGKLSFRELENNSIFTFLP